MTTEAELLRFFDADHLAEQARLHHDAYVSAEPFPHVALDGFFPDAYLEDVAARVPPPSESWVRRERKEAVKWGLPDERRMDPSIRSLIHELQGPAFLQFLEGLTGIRGLVPDPYLVGGGIHQIERGGFLKIHADFNVHIHMKLQRRLNLLLYLNRDWQEDWGGHLELWDRKMERCVQRYAPSFNRCVIFNITDWAYHGHPDPLDCPQDVTRRSLALYYYTATRPREEQTAGHDVLYQHRGIAPAPATEARSAESVPPQRISLLRRALRRLRWGRTGHSRR